MIMKWSSLKQENKPTAPKCKWISYNSYVTKTEGAVGLSFYTEYSCVKNYFSDISQYNNLFFSINENEILKDGAFSEAKWTSGY